MNELLGRVVKLTEPLERAQRGGEYVAERLKKAIFGAEAGRDRGGGRVEEAEEAVAEAKEAESNFEGGSEDVAEEPPDSSSER